MKLTCMHSKFEAFKPYASFVVDDALNGRELGADQHAVVTDKSVLVCWQVGFEPLCVAVNSYLGCRIEDDEAEELATDYLKELNWFSDPGADNFPDYLVRNY